MPDETALRAKAREAIPTGKLPSRRPDRTWGGRGVGALCTVCGEAVTEDHLELEVQFARDGDNPGLDKFHIHVRCFAAWEFSTPTGKVVGTSSTWILGGVPAGNRGYFSAPVVPAASYRGQVLFFDWGKAAVRRRARSTQRSQLGIL
jgi:hypothetical protein